MRPSKLNDGSSSAGFIKTECARSGWELSKETSRVEAPQPKEDPSIKSSKSMADETLRDIPPLYSSDPFISR
jgi:hypothetical protein